MKRSAILLALACLALGWSVMPILPRAWGLEHVHGLFAGAALYGVAYARAAFPPKARGGRPSFGRASLGGFWGVVLARAGVFIALLAAFLYVVFDLYRSFDVRWHLTTFAAWVLAEDLAERFRATRTREA